MKRLIVYIAFFSYGTFEWITNFQYQLLEANLLLISNLVIILFLILARLKAFKAERGSLKKVSMEIEDIHQVKLERIAYNAATYIQIAFTLSLISMLVGFILLRNTHPVIVLWSLILLGISFVSLFPSEKIVRITNPNFKFPDPQSENYEQEYFNQFDDGEKFVILKGLYKLYGTVIWGLILLASALMFYSVFSDDSQVVGIIGIGILLLLIQVSYTMSIKPSKHNLK